MKKFCFVSVFCYFLYFASSQSNNFVCINPNNPSLINNCKLVPGKKGERGPKGEKGELGGVTPEQIISLKEKINIANARLNGLKDQPAKRKKLGQNSTITGFLGLSKIDSCQSANVSGVFLMEFNGSAIEVYCEVEPDGETKWLVFQRRIDGSENFYRNWINYQHGFGNKSGEFWLGLEILHAITKYPQSYQLRVDLKDWDGNTIYAVYRKFIVGNSDSNYTLTVGNYNGNAGDSLFYHNNQEFTTKDRHNDAGKGYNCAVEYHGAWWYRDCYRSNLNGKYFSEGQKNNDGIVWFSWKQIVYSFKEVKMKIRPNPL